MPAPTPGIHHITCGAGEPQVNLDFYTSVLGLRLVKICVNQDDTSVYHFFYGDATGRPGADLTFFPHPHIPKGKRGAGQVTATAFAVAEGAIDYWMARFAEHGVPCEQPAVRFGQRVLTFYDPDGLRLELVETPEADPGLAWARGPIPLDHALRGFHSVTLEVVDPGPTVDLLTDLFGFRRVGYEDGRLRLQAQGGGPASIVDVVQNPTKGVMGVGMVQHIAWRAPDERTHLEYLRALEERGIPCRGVIDRYYFKSIYFREPGGILYEIATDGPGFTVDEPEESLGTELKLPPFLEPRRAEIEAGLPRLRWPAPPK